MRPRSSPPTATASPQTAAASSWRLRMKLMVHYRSDISHSKDFALSCPIISCYPLISGFLMFAGLNLKQLEAFYWVAHLGGFSAAAARLNTTQPGVSMRLRGLEERVGAPVFDRSRRGRGSRLTPKGRDLLGLVEQLVEIDREWQDRLGGPAALTGIVRVGAADTMAMTLLPSLLAQVAARHPDIDVELIVDLSVHLQARLREGEIDVAFMVGDMGSPEY